MNPTKDSTSNLIATLGVICTVLIGWQIFSLVNLFQYEKRIKTLEEDIEQSKENLNESINGAYKSMNKSDGLTYHALADIYRHLGDNTYSLPEVCQNKQIAWLLAEVEICLYTHNIDELNRVKNDISNIKNSNVILPDSFKDEIKEQWNGIKERFQKTSLQKSKIILDEIGSMNQLIDSI